jgi:hypothetical protein
MLNSNQALTWPRLNVFIEAFDAFNSSPNVFTPLDGVIPVVLKNAVCEAALRALVGTLADDLQNGIKSKSIAGAISTTYASHSGNATMRYQVIDMYLTSLLKASSDVVRG